MHFDPVIAITFTFKTGPHFEISCFISLLLQWVYYFDNLICCLFVKIRIGAIYFDFKSKIKLTYKNSMDFR